MRKITRKDILSKRWIFPFILSLISTVYFLFTSVSIMTSCSGGVLGNLDCGLRIFFMGTYMGLFTTAPIAVLSILLYILSILIWQSKILSILIVSIMIIVHTISIAAFWFFMGYALQKGVLLLGKKRKKRK